jgi:hypothetical protein
MNKTVLMILAIAACFTAAAKMQKHKKKQLLPANNIISVSMRHTACYGHCPDYTIEINKNGTVTYTGRSSVQDTGVFTKKISEKKAAEVLETFSRYRVDTCKELYENRIPDLSGINYEIKYPDKLKKIYCANWGPAFLKQLAQTVDSAGNKTDNAGWKKIGSRPR